MQATNNQYEQEREANIRRNNEQLRAIGLSGYAANFTALTGKKQVQQSKAPDQPADQPTRVVATRNTATQPGMGLKLHESGSDSEEDPTYCTGNRTSGTDTGTDDLGEEELDTDPGSPRSEGQKGQDQPACPPTPGRY